MMGWRCITESNTCLVTIISKILHPPHSQTKLNCNYVRPADQHSRPCLSLSQPRHGWSWMLTKNYSCMKHGISAFVLFQLCWNAFFRNQLIPGVFATLRSTPLSQTSATFHNHFKGITSVTPKWKPLEIRTQAVMWHTSWVRDWFFFSLDSCMLYPWPWEHLVEREFLWRPILENYK